MPGPIKKEDIKKALTEALEPFAGAIKEDFNRIDERFDKIDERFNGTDQRLTNISTTVANLEVDMKEMKPNVKETREIMNKLFDRIDRFLAKLEALDQELLYSKKILKE